MYVLGPRADCRRSCGGWGGWGALGRGRGGNGGGSWWRMADPVLERDIQEMLDLEALIAGGDERARRLHFFAVSQIAKEMTKWQWCIHGDTATYRQRGVRWLCREDRPKLARRFALWGRG